MCGIVGYIGEKNIESVLIVGLERLSYRGYDSSGIAVLSHNEMSWWKKKGKIKELKKTLKGQKVKGDLGIGHTRWATHGSPNEPNAHPHVTKLKKVAVVHNGIIENYQILKEALIKEGYIFQSETDTEVISNLIEKYLKNNTLEKAVESAVEKIKGTYAIAVISEHSPGKIVATKKGSPLIIGLGKEENYISSDINAFITQTKKTIYLEDNELAIVTKNSITVKEVNGPVLDKEIQTIKWDPISAEKQGYPHYMLKEIWEQPTIVRTILEKYIQDDQSIEFKHLKLNTEQLKKITRFIIQACGTSWHAGMVGKYLLEKHTRTLTEVDISSEFRYREMIVKGQEVVIALSQSGETADTLACLREAKSKFYHVISFVNAKNSSMDRESDGVIYSHAGQEVGVASTKNYVAQITTLVLFTLFLGQLRGTLSKETYTSLIQELSRIPDYIEQTLEKTNEIEAISKKYFKSRDFLFIGRAFNYATALEGALKLKEISYIHATGYAAGELKHGPIALIDEHMPVLCICPKNTDTYHKMISNIQEVKARGAKTIIIATEGDTQIAEFADDIIYIPSVSQELSPILTILPLQLLSYYIALQLGCDVDQPRNLAKSVTVE